MTLLFSGVAESPFSEGCQRIGTEQGLAPNLHLPPMWLHMPKTSNGMHPNLAYTIVPAQQASGNMVIYLRK